GERRPGAGIAVFGAPVNVRGVQPDSGSLLVVPRQSRSGEKRLDTAAFSAVAGGPGPLVLPGPGERVMTPFAGDRVRPGQRAAVDDNAAARSGAEDGAEDDPGTGRG